MILMLSCRGIDKEMPFTRSKKHADESKASTATVDTEMSGDNDIAAIKSEHEKLNRKINDYMGMYPNSEYWHKQNLNHVTIIVNEEIQALLNDDQDWNVYPDDLATVELKQLEETLNNAINRYADILYKMGFLRSSALSGLCAKIHDTIVDTGIIREANKIVKKLEDITLPNEVEKQSCLEALAVMITDKAIQLKLANKLDDDEFPFEPIHVGLSDPQASFNEAVIDYVNMASDIHALNNGNRGQITKIERFYELKQYLEGIISYIQMSKTAKPDENNRNKRALDTSSSSTPACSSSSTVKEPREKLIIISKSSLTLFPPQSGTQEKTAVSERSKAAEFK